MLCSLRSCEMVDKVTSALDTESAHFVQKAIDDVLARGMNNELDVTDDLCDSSRASGIAFQQFVVRIGSSFSRMVKNLIVLCVHPLLHCLLLSRLD